MAMSYQHCPVQKSLVLPLPPVPSGVAMRFHVAPPSVLLNIPARPVLTFTLLAMEAYSVEGLEGAATSVMRPALVPVMRAVEPEPFAGVHVKPAFVDT